jgi:hypothetical protein
VERAAAAAGLSDSGAVVAMVEYCDGGARNANGRIKVGSGPFDNANPGLGIVLATLSLTN